MARNPTVVLSSSPVSFDPVGLFRQTFSRKRLKTVPRRRCLTAAQHDVISSGIWIRRRTPTARFTARVFLGSVESFRCDESVHSRIAVRDDCRRNGIFVAVVADVQTQKYDPLNTKQVVTRRRTPRPDDGVARRPTEETLSLILFLPTYADGSRRLRVSRIQTVFGPWLVRVQLYSVRDCLIEIYVFPAVRLY